MEDMDFFKIYAPRCFKRIEAPIHPSERGAAASLVPEEKVVFSQGIITGGYIHDCAEIIKDADYRADVNRFVSDIPSATECCIDKITSGIPLSVAKELLLSEIPVSDETQGNKQQIFNTIFLRAVYLLVLTLQL
ncbi:hypothetical protein OZX73_01700 [Bifidobacterium sp. ESL0775]|uniref:hypothetical protein n=1 Tax=Bifidobacterium sp. ESL0775 TaxID=2983230 RepID=UPI0023F85ED1|nr:hypothetical protein [Bifidobacterium sp. ESL0775]WEV69626.1 hypothetical protein OZX73_01700 [Bifidobacterium sp. ESL0775]